MQIRALLLEGVPESELGGTQVRLRMVYLVRRSHEHDLHQTRLPVLPKANQRGESRLAKQRLAANVNSHLRWHLCMEENRSHHTQACEYHSDRRFYLTPLGLVL